jgi:hypothetical protein
MNRVPDTERLLRDVLSEGEPSGFMESQLARTLGLARGRRIYRRTLISSTAVALVAAAVLGLRSLPMAHRNLAVESVVIIETHPLDASSIISTKLLKVDQIVSSVSGAAVVRTSHQVFHLLDDRELLALVSPRPAILIRMGESSEILNFANTENDSALRAE